MSGVFPYASATFRRLWRNLRLFRAETHLNRAYRTLPVDMTRERLAIIEARLRVLNAMDLKPMDYDEFMRRKTS